MKYQNKISGELAETNKFNNAFYTANNAEVIPRRFIENNTDWRKVEEVKYEIGKWYRNSVGLFCVTEVKDNTVFAYGFCREEWSDNSSFPIKKYIEEDVLACEEEIETALIAEAKKRGFRENERLISHWKKEEITHYNVNGEFKFELEFNTLFIGNYVIFDKSGWAEVLEQKEPLFKSIDGVDIYENDTVFCVLKGTCASRDILIRKGSDNSPNHLWTGYFSTQQKADEYALMNKECLSLKDILIAWEDNEYLRNIDDYKQSPLFNNFKKAVEAKMRPKSNSILPQEYINEIDCTEVTYIIKK